MLRLVEIQDSREGTVVDNCGKEYIVLDNKAQTSFFKEFGFFSFIAFLIFLNVAVLFAENGLFKDLRIKNAMLSVDRADFCPQNPYEDHPESIGYGATISAPHMVIVLH